MQDRKSAIAEFERDFLHIAAHVTLMQAELIRDTRAFLLNLAAVPEIKDPSSPECNAFLEGLLPLVPNYVNLGVPRADGELLCSALPLSQTVNVADRPYIRQALDGRQLGAGTYQIDRAANTDSVNFAVPLFANQESHAPVGAVVAAVSLDWWSESLAATNLPEEALAYVVDNYGQIIATFPKRPELLGRQIDEFSLDKDGEFLVDGRVALHPDGVQRILTRQTLFADQQLRQMEIVLSMPVDETIAEATQTATRQVAWLLLLLSLQWVVAIRILEKIVVRPFDALRHEVLEASGPEPRSGGQSGVIDPHYASEFEHISDRVRQLSDGREQAERDRDSRSEQLSALLGALPDMYFRVDQFDTILDVRTNDTSDLAMAHREIPGRKVLDLLSPDAAALYQKNMRELREGGQIATWDYVFEVDGTALEFEARACPIEGTTEAVIVVRNVTLARAAERDRTIAVNRLTRIIDNLPAAVISLDLGAGLTPQVVFASPQIERLWGHSADSILANPDLLEALYSSQDLSGQDLTFVEAARTDIPFHSRFKLQDSFGNEKWIEAQNGGTHSADGRILSDVILMDVTREVEMRAQLEAQKDVAFQAQKHESLGQLTGGVAHDFNNLLAVIMGNLELLRDDLSDPDQVQQIEAGLTAVQRGADLTQKMLAFARKARLAPRVLNLNSVVRDMRSWAGRTVPANVTLEFDLEPDLWAVRADPSSTESALINLVLNACDALQGRGQVKIRTANIVSDTPICDDRQDCLPSGHYVMLEVSDTGVGIAQDAISRIFEPFYSTKPAAAGSGLGLSMVLGFMQQSGGALHVHSSPGEGATFRLYFRSLGSRKMEEEPKVAARTSPYRVLVVEDETDVLQVLSSTLDKAGYHVISAEDGEMARDLFMADPNGVDLLLTDIIMPGEIQGGDLARLLRETRPGLKVVFLSGYVGEFPAEALTLLPGDRRLTKPVRREDLLDAIAKALPGKSTGDG